MLIVLKTKSGQKVKIEAQLLGKYSELVGNMLDQIEEKEEILLPFYNISEETMV